MYGHERKLVSRQGVVDLRSVDVEEALVHLGRRSPVDLDDSVPVRLGYGKGQAQRVPTHELVHAYVEVCASVGYHVHAVAHFALVVKQKVLRRVELVASRIAAKDLYVGPASRKMLIQRQRVHRDEIVFCKRGCVRGQNHILHPAQRRIRTGLPLIDIHRRTA